MTIKQRLFWSGLGTMGVVAILEAAAIAVLAAGLGGCAATVAPGPESRQAAGEMERRNTPPSSVGIIEDGQGKINWQSAGTAGTKAVRVTPDEVTQLGTGPATRQVVYRTESTNIVVSSETDFGVDQVVFDPKSGTATIKGFKTSASTPTTALAVTMAQWVAEVQAWAPAERDAVIEKLRQQADTIKATTPTAADALVRLAALLAGA